MGPLYFDHRQDKISIRRVVVKVIPVMPVAQGLEAFQALLQIKL